LNTADQPPSQVIPVIPIYIIPGLYELFTHFPVSGMIIITFEIQQIGEYT